MTCDAIEPELVGYHFGTLDDETRAKVEAHLCACAACVRAFVETKRAIETSEDAPAPSAAARARLRRAVARELGVAPRVWWERPIAIALAASVVLIAGATMHALTTGNGQAPYALRAGR
ncbi:MAG TPA: zf-HC2 domain-containing protein [Polyangiaceae bacterium]|jgi:anti-sigma factor RsiW